MCQQKETTPETTEIKHFTKQNKQKTAYKNCLNVVFHTQKSVRFRTLHVTNTNKA